MSNSENPAEVQRQTKQKSELIPESTEELDADPIKIRTVQRILGPTVSLLIIFLPLTQTH